MIAYKQGDIFLSQAEVLTCPVNLQGTLGKGLALQFKQRFGLQTAYKNALYGNWLKADSPYLCTYCRPKVLLFATKVSWRQPSKIDTISEGLATLRRNVLDGTWKFKSIALPSLGCGLGQLPWTQVRMEIEHYLGDLDIDIEVYEPLEEAI